MGSFSKENVLTAIKNVFNIDRRFNEEEFSAAAETLAEMISDNASSGDGYSYLANVSQTGTSAPFVIAQITNTFTTTPTFTYKSVGCYRITFGQDNWLNTYGHFNNGVCVSAGSSAVIGTFAMAAESASSVLLFTYNNSSVSANNILNNTALKISQGRVGSITNYLDVRDIVGNTQRLEFGRALYATDGYDNNLGEYELPPVNPAGNFDARLMPASSFLTGGVSFMQGSLKDYRDIQTVIPTSEYRFKFQFGDTRTINPDGARSDPAFPFSVSGEGVNVRFILSPLVQRVRIQDIVTGSLFDRTLTASGTANLSGNVLGFNQYKFTVTYF